VHAACAMIVAFVNYFLAIFTELYISPVFQFRPVLNGLSVSLIYLHEQSAKIDLVAHVNLIFRKWSVVNKRKCLF
jgi:hypothetical protein